MELLDENQTQQVWKALEEAYQTPGKLADELLDHFCCFIEVKLSEGKTFDRALEDAFEHIAPNGPKELEEELELIMNLKPQKKMKLTFYTSAMISAFCILMGITLRTLHWFDQATVLFFVGFLSLLLFVFPSVATMAYRNRQLLNSGDIFRIIVGILGGAIISIGALFKGLHYPGANLMIVCGTVFLCFLFLPLFFYQLYKRAAL